MNHLRGGQGRSAANVGETGRLLLWLVAVGAAALLAAGLFELLT